MGKKEKKHTRTFSAEKLQILQQKAKNVRDALSQDQIEVLNKFITTLEEEGLTPKQRKFCDEPCLVRYLRARDFNMDKAHKLLRGTLKWREETRVEQYSAEFLTDVSASGKVYRHGFDLFGRPTIFMTPSRENSKKYAKSLQLLVFTIERAIESMQEGQQMVWVIDFSGFSLSNAPPINIALETLNILSNHYPERLGTAIMTDTPWIFGVFWKAVSPFINPVTYNKIVFANGEAEKQKVFSRYFDPNQLEKRFGGKHDFMFDDNFWKVEIAEDQKRMKKLGISPLNESMLLSEKEPLAPAVEETSDYQNLSAEELSLD